jgi:6-phosphogluconolactonase (cycloisomerase 2 family)
LISNNPGYAAVGGGGKFLYVGELATNEVFAFSIDGTTGALTALSPASYSVGSIRLMSIVDSSGAHLYVGTDNAILTDSPHALGASAFGDVMTTTISA